MTHLTPAYATYEEQGWEVYWRSTTTGEVHKIVRTSSEQSAKTMAERLNEAYAVGLKNGSRGAAGVLDTMMHELNDLGWPTDETWRKARAVTDFDSSERMANLHPLKDTHP